MGIIWLDGEYMEGGNRVPTSDGGFLRGLGVFDTMLGRNGVPVDYQLHLQRLINDCKTVLLHHPEIDIEKMSEIAATLLHKNDLMSGHARIRTQVTAGKTKELLGKPEKLMIIMGVAKAVVPEIPAPVHAIIVDDYPRIARCRFENCKKQDYTRSYYAKQTALATGANEALITNTDGNIVCATTSNLFIIEKDSLITPPLSDGALNGITRKKMIAKYNAAEESISRERLMAADGVILTNSILGIRPVTKIGDDDFADRVGDITLAA